MLPSENRSAVGREDGIACESPYEGRDLNGARSMQALPWEGGEGRRPAVRKQFRDLA